MNSWTCSSLWSWSSFLSHVLWLRIILLQNVTKPVLTSWGSVLPGQFTNCVPLCPTVYFFLPVRYIRPTTTAGVNTDNCWGGDDQHRDGQERWRDRSEIQLILFVWELSSAIITTRRSPAYIMEILTAEYEKCRHYWRAEMRTRWV